MSDVSVDIIKNRNGEAPDLPSGANLSGVSTAATPQVTNLNPTHINASGITTATTFSGSLKSTGTPTLGLGVTINSSGLNISGVATAGIVSATTLFGDGSNLTGVAFSIAPISYQPDVNDTLVTRFSGLGIGVTFTQRIASGSGDITLRIAGAAGTYVEAFGIAVDTTYTVTVQSTDSGNKYLLNGVQQDDPVLYPGGVYTFDQSDSSNSNHPFRFSITSNGTHGGGSTYSTGVEVNGTPGNAGAYTRITVSASTPTPLYYYCTQHSGMGNFVTIGREYSISNNAVSFTPTADLEADTVYHINYPSGIFTNTAGDLNYVGTAYTFTSGASVPEIWSMGRNYSGEFGGNYTGARSSPVQIPGTTWNNVSMGVGFVLGSKTDGTLWAWGGNIRGVLGQNDQIERSSPTQVGSDTTWNITEAGTECSFSIKTDGTLWAWGNNEKGRLGLNDNNPGGARSSPVQIPGTTWSSISAGDDQLYATKTNGTLWAWGSNSYGKLGQNNETKYSSPVQIPGTTWSKVQASYHAGVATKTDGTLWVWGSGIKGGLGQNNRTSYSSPVQIPGTDWSEIAGGREQFQGAIKTDGTLWGWGENQQGELAQNDRTEYSSPVQVPGTSWSKIAASGNNMMAVKTDGTLWGWGSSTYGRLGQNQAPSIKYSSPVQVPGTSWNDVSGSMSSDTSFILNKLA